MIKNIAFFIAAFIAGAVIALAVRSARFQPHATAPGPAEAPAYAPMVDNSTHADGHTTGGN